MNQFIVIFNTRGAVGICCVAVVPHYMTMTNVLCPLPGNIYSGSELSPTLTGSDGNCTKITINS